MLLRLLRRKTLFESSDPREVIQAEFTDDSGDPDLNLSVFEIDYCLNNAVRVRAEQTAGNELNPSNRSSIDLSGIRHWQIQITPTENTLFNFSYASESHRELTFQNEMELHELAEVLLKESQARKIDITKKDVIEYAREKYLSQDNEWVQVCNRSSKVREWVLGRKA